MGTETVNDYVLLLTNGFLGNRKVERIDVREGILTVEKKLKL